MSLFTLTSTCSKTTFAFEKRQAQHSYTNTKWQPAAPALYADLKLCSMLLALRTTVRASEPSEGSNDTCTRLMAAWREAWTIQRSHT